MTRSIQWNVVAYMVITALLASLFYSYNLAAGKWHSQSADLSFPLLHGNKQPAFTSIVYPYEPAIAKSMFQPLTVIPRSTEGSQTEVSQASTLPDTTHSSSPAIETPSHTYRVTSYYLNVRALPNAESKILREVKQHTVLPVQARTDNGWLSLTEGGFVNERYTEVVVSGDVATATAVTVKPSQRVAVQAVSAPTLQADQPTQSQSITTDADNPSSDDTESSSNPLKPGSKVMSDSGLSKAHIAVLLKGTKLEKQGLEDVILSVEDQYGINAFFTIAVMKLESGNGKSYLAQTKNNLFGLNAVTGNARQKAFSFTTKADCVRKFGQLINDNYVERGYTTIDKVARKYCPANGSWAGYVRTIMRSDFGKVT